MLTRRLLMRTSIGPSNLLSSTIWMRVPGSRTAALKLAQAAGIVVRDCPARRHSRPPGIRSAGASLSGRTFPSGWGWRGRGVQLGTAEQLEDPLLHALRDDMLQTLGLVVHLVPAVAEDLDQEHLEQAVVADELQGRPCRPSRVSCCPRYRSCATRPWAVRRVTISLTEATRCRVAGRARGWERGVGRRGAGRALSGSPAALACGHFEVAVPIPSS